MVTAYELLGALMTGADVKQFEEWIPRPKWMAHGACTDPNVTANFFPTRGESSEPAKAVWARCSVIEQCLEYALARDEKNGIWAGTSDRQRRIIRRERGLTQRSVA